MVDTRIKFDNRWSNATYTRYLAPTIESLSSSVGGTKRNASNGFAGEQKIVSISDVPTILEVRSRGEKNQDNRAEFLANHLPAILLVSTKIMSS